MLEQGIVSITNYSLLEQCVTDCSPWPYTGISEAEIRLKYAQEESEQLRKGVPALDDVTPSAFFALALELEEEQCI
jgi:hypothetical protein